MTFRRGLFKLFLELFELQAQAFHFARKRFDAVFETDYSLGFGRFARLFADRLLALEFFDLYFSCQQVRKPRFFLACQARQLDD